MQTNAMIGQMLQISGWQVERTMEGLNEAQWLEVPSEGLACASWIVGHAVLIDRQTLEELDIPSLPSIPDEWPSLYRIRPDEGAIREYHPGQFIFAQFAAHRKALVQAVSEAAAESLNRELAPFGEQRYNPMRGDEDNPLLGPKTLTEMVGNLALYTSQVAGE